MNEGFPRKEVRKFSKQNAPAERMRLAEQIRSERHEAFSARERLKVLRERALSRSEDAAKVASGITKIEEELIALRSNRFNELMGFFKKKKNLERLNTLRTVQEHIAADQETFTGSIRELEDLSDQGNLLKKTDALLTRFYSDQENVWNERQEFLRETSVPQITRTEGVTFVHAVNPGVSMHDANNPLLSSPLSWKQKLDIVLTLDPTVSASTIRPGQNAGDSLWGRMGVLLNDGRVLDAHRRDMGTVVTSLRSRTRSIGLTVSLPEEIKDAVRSTDGGYNELVIAEPKVFGIYVSRDERTHHPDTTDLAPDVEINEYASQRDIPVYLLEKGSVYTTFFNSATGKFEKGDLVSLEVFLQSKVALSNAKRSEILSGLENEAVFNSPIVEKVDENTQDKYA